MRPRNRRLLPALFLGLGLALAWTPGATPTRPALAQGVGLEALGSADAPIEINAENGIEWHRDQKAYFARGNASAKRGEVTVFGDTLTAHYRELASGDTEIWRLEADGNVRITSPDETAYGDHAIYDVDTSVLVLTGDGLKLVSADSVVTAEDSLEYWQARQMAVARGDGTAVRDGRTLSAEVLVSFFRKTEAGETVLERIEAFDNVVVNTDQDRAAGNRGVYDTASGVAHLYGDVVLTRGKSRLSGEYGTIDLDSGVSRLLPAPDQAGGNRVTGVIVPPPRKAPDAAPAAEAAE
ncbi:MAG: LptA/OstA family protein [Alphaproteobacteria bacterium]